MSTTDIQQDLAYVRGAVERQDDCRELPLSVAAIVSAFVVIGFTWVDFAPSSGGIFLMVAGPLAFLAAWLVGRRSAFRLGVADGAGSRKHFLHWGSGFLAMGSFTVIAVAGEMNGQTLGQAILIGFGLAHYLGGVHFASRTFFFTGLAALVGAPLLTYVDRWGWTLLGILIAAALLAGSRKRVVENG